MPCHSDYSDVGRTTQALDTVRAGMEACRRELDLTTRLLCGLLSKLKEADEALAADPELRAWWERHQALDEQETA